MGWLTPIKSDQWCGYDPIDVPYTRYLVALRLGLDHVAVLLWLVYSWSARCKVFSQLHSSAPRVTEHCLLRIWL